MVWIQIALLICTHELLYMVATHQQMGILPYPCGSTVICYFTHFVLLVTNIWYWGWIVGIVLSVCEIFCLIHSSVGWVLEIPTLNLLSEKNILKLVRFEVAVLTSVSLLALVFCVVSFFISPFSSGLHMVKDNPIIIVVFAAVVVVLSVVRVFVSKHVSSNNMTKN